MIFAPRYSHAGAFCHPYSIHNEKKCPTTTAFNEDFTKVTRCGLLGPLPDVLKFDDGSPVETPDQWPKRRAEIRKTAVDLQFGHMPPEPEFPEVETLYIGDPGSFRT